MLRITGFKWKESSGKVETVECTGDWHEVGNWAADISHQLDKLEILLSRDAVKITEAVETKLVAGKKRWFTLYGVSIAIDPDLFKRAFKVNVESNPVILVTR